MIHWTTGARMTKGIMFLETLPTGARFPLKPLQTEELRQALSRALTSLTPKHREVFVLRDVQHFTIEETAMVLGIGKSAVKTRLLRARLQMRDALAPGMDGSWSTGRRDYEQVRPW